MKVRAHKLIVITFIFSFISLLAAAAPLTFRIINDTTGLNLGYLLPGCNNSYNNLKYAYIYIILIVQFVANIICAVTALLRCIMLIPPLIEVCKGSQESEGQKGEKQVKIEVIYICVSLQLLCWIVSMGGCLNVWIEAKSCLNQFLFYNLLVGILSLVAGIITLICWILVMCLSRCVKVNEIRFDDLKLNGKQDKLNRSINGEQDELNRRMDEEMREYLQEINKNKQQMDKELLAYEQEIYNSNRIKKEQQNTNEERQSNEDSEYQYYYEEVEVGKQDQEINEDQIVQTKHEDEEIQPSPELSPQDPNSKALGSLSPRVSKRSEKKKADVQVELLKVPNQNEDVESNQQEQNNNNPSEATPQNRKMGQLSRNSSNSPTQKTPIRPKRVQVIEDDGWSQLQAFKLDAADQPVSEQLNKLLKVTLFQNSAFFKSNKPILQQECPLLKYLQRDSRFQISQPEKFDKKNRKNEYSKQKLFFAKKRKEKMNQVELYRKLMKQQFNENLAVKRERVDLLNEKQVGYIQKNQQDREEHLASRYKKFNILQSIRSKYYN